MTSVFSIQQRGAMRLARSHAAMILGLLGGLALVFWLEGIEVAPPPPADPMAAFADVTPLPLAPRRVPTASEMKAATIAWRYFQNNISPATGLVASVDKYPSTTLWETGALLDAIISAEQLGMISNGEAVARLERALDSLSRLPLLAEGMPNKVYDIRSLEMVNYKNQPTKIGLGWDGLFETDYTAKLVAAVDGLNNPDRGWMEGRYEKDGTPDTAITASTNALILSAIAFRKAGPLMQVSQ
jgi:hypothetical protein